MADGRQRIAQLVRQRGEEVVLAPVGFAQRILGFLDAADVEIESGPSGDAAFFVAHGDALGEHGVVAFVGAQKAMLAIPRLAGANALLPGRDCADHIVGMQQVAPAQAGTFGLGDAHQLQERIAGVEIAAMWRRRPRRHS